MERVCVRIRVDGDGGNSEFVACLGDDGPVGNKELADHDRRPIWRDAWREMPPCLPDHRHSFQRVEQYALDNSVFRRACRSWRGDQCLDGTDGGGSIDANHRGWCSYAHPSSGDLIGNRFTGDLVGRQLFDR